MARIKLLFFRTNFWIASLAGEDSSVIRSRSSCRWSILQMIITMPNSIMNEFNTNMHRPNGRKARQQCGKATWNTTLRASRPREAGWIGRGRSRGEPRWWHGHYVIIIPSISSNLTADHHHNHDDQKVFRRLEEERLGQLQAMAALYLQVINVIVFIIMIVIFTIKRPSPS